MWAVVSTEGICPIVEISFLKKERQQGDRLSLKMVVLIRVLSGCACDEAIT